MCAVDGHSTCFRLLLKYTDLWISRFLKSTMKLVEKGAVFGEVASANAR
jgi:hypothetical protein